MNFSNFELLLYIFRYKWPWGQKYSPYRDENVTFARKSDILSSFAWNEKLSRVNRFQFMTIPLTGHNVVWSFYGECPKIFSQFYTHRKGQDLSYLMPPSACLSDKPFGWETPKSFVTYAVLALKNQFLDILAGKGPFFRVGYREEGTTRAEMLSNDTIYMSLRQIVWAVQVAQTYLPTNNSQTIKQSNNQTNKQTDKVFWKCVFWHLGTWIGGHFKVF